ncbi:MAG: hypothetical protein QM487_03300 [Candidatus Marithrix sp.]
MALSIFTVAYFSIKAVEVQITQLVIAKNQNKLITIRNNKKQQILLYLTELHKKARLYANNTTIISAMYNFKNVFFQTEKPTDKYRNIVSAYYKNNFLKEYKLLNNHLPTSLPKLDNKAITMQYHYIVNNSLPINEYYKTHKIYHNSIRQLKNNDIEDILLIDSETNTVVYSTNKNIDFAVSLSKQASLASLNHIVQQINSSNKTELIDFTPYFPYYNNHVAFIGTPIFLDEQKIGILILQINSESINNIMTNNKVWQFAEAGKTGESYIVAIDSTMRNDSRKLIEYQEEYLLAIEQAGLSNDIVTEIKLKDTSIGLQKVDTVGTKNVFNGITGQDLYVDYNDEFVFATYTPLKIFGLQWAIFVTIQETEVLELVTRFTDKITNTIIQIAVIIFILASIILWLIMPSANSKIPKGYTIEQIIRHIKKLK